MHIREYFVVESSSLTRLLPFVEYFEISPFFSIVNYQNFRTCIHMMVAQDHFIAKGRKKLFPLKVK